MTPRSQPGNQAARKANPARIAVNIRVTADQHARIRAGAAARGLTVSDWVRLSVLAETPRRNAHKRPLTALGA